MSVEPNPVAKLSAVEQIKENSRQLRGTVSAELVEDTDHFSEDNKQLLKFHGTYQQEDRDARKDRRARGVGKHTCSWSAARFPAAADGDQYLALDELADRLRQRHAALHHPAGHPVPRRPQDAPEGRPSPASTTAC